MGCCCSRPSGPNAPNPGSPSTRPAAQASPPSVEPPPRVAPPANDNDGQSPEHSQPRNRSGSQQPLSHHIDKPLRQHTWTSVDRSWTREALDRERTEFFDTRVSGRADVWQVIKAALQEIWEGDRKALNAQDQDVNSAAFHTGALATAQGILQAAEITLPTGDLADGLYDAQGNYYRLHEWVVCDPINITSDPDAKARSPEPDDTLPNAVDSADDEELLRRREAKGKSTKAAYKIRVRLSDSARDYAIRATSDETIGQISAKVRQVSKQPANAQVRLAYLGKMLNDNKSLEETGFQTGHVMNAFISS